jgi:hypothetical protein
MRCTGWVAAVLTGLFVFFPSTSHSAFQQGDLYLLSQGLPNQQGSGLVRGIVRIDPTSGASTLVYTSSLALGLYLEYDSFRDLLVFTRHDSLYGMDPSANLTLLEALPPWQEGAIASRGDGPIYIQLDSEIHYLDTGNVMHPLLDQAGTGTFAIGGAMSIRQLHYHEPTQSLIACFSGGAVAVCPDNTKICVAKVPLNAAGTQVIGPVTAVQYEVSGSGEEVAGLDDLPGGEVLVVCDTNSNDAEPRILSLDPATMSVGVYASSGSYIGAAALNAGCYSAAYSQVVVLDTFANILRGFPQGGSGEGNILPTTGWGLSGFGSNEFASLVAVVVKPTSVADTPKPSAIVFEAPYPNPFSPSTTMRFHLENSSSVRLDVFDVQGRRVRALIDGRRAPGWHDAAWDGTDEHGARMASGVYFARLTAAGETKTQRFVLVR